MCCVMYRKQNENSTITATTTAPIPVISTTVTSASGETIFRVRLSTHETEMIISQKNQAGI